MNDDMVKVEIELEDEEWDMLEKCRIESKFDSLDEFINHILKEVLEREEE